MKKQAELRDSYCVKLQGTLERWDDKTQEWEPVETLTDREFWQAWETLEDMCNCRRWALSRFAGWCPPWLLGALLSCRVLRKKHACNQTLSSQEQKTFELGVMFDDDPNFKHPEYHAPVYES